VARANRIITFDAIKAKKKKQAGKDPLLAVRKGGRARLTGDLTSPQNQAGCESNQTVEIQRKKPSQADFTAFQQVRTDAAGNFSIESKVKKTFEYRAVAAQTAVCQAATSSSEKVKAKKKKKKK
jgi:hypothetical protein